MDLLLTLASVLIIKKVLQQIQEMLSNTADTRDTVFVMLKTFEDDKQTSDDQDVGNYYFRMFTENP